MKLAHLQVETPHGAPVLGAEIFIAGETRYRAREEGGGRYVVPLDDPGDHQLQVARFGRPDGFDHRTLRTTLCFRPGATGQAAELRALAPPDSCPVSRVRDIRVVEDGWVLSIVLDYLWFTPVGTAPSTGNAVRVLIDGEAAWGAVAETIEAARERVHVITWLYQPTAELRRPEPLADPAERHGNTIHALLSARAKAGVRVRLLTWDAPFVGLAEEAAAAADTAGDQFEVLQEVNMTEGRVLREDEYPVLSALLGAHPLFSFHQKTVTVDGVVGYCGGMNMKGNDWDRPSHALFEPRRAHFTRPHGYRARIAEALQVADNPPRHDFIAEVRGPAVADLEANFVQRWNHVRESGGAWSQNATEAQPIAPPSAAGTTAVQVVRTMPEPYAERGILDLYLRAIAAARRLIYIEDQYFRSTHISDALSHAVRAWPELRVIVVTLRSYANSLLQGGWCWESFQRIRERRPDFELYTLQVAQENRDGEMQDLEVDIHAKLMIVDDLFLTLGSCNVNDRGFELEGEINVAIQDAALARDTRVRLWREHLGDDPGVTGDITADLAVWDRHVEQNRETGGEVYRVSNVVPFTPTARAPVFDKDVW